MVKSNDNACSGFVRLPLPEAVAGHLREVIRRGDFGDRLPGERELSVMLKISRTSVREALEKLAAEGLLLRRHGRVTQIVATTAYEKTA